MNASASVRDGSLLPGKEKQGASASVLRVFGLSESPNRRPWTLKREHRRRADTLRAGVAAARAVSAIGGAAPFFS